MKTKNENAKDPDFIVPVQLPGVKPEKYQPEIDAQKAENAEPVKGPPDNPSEKPPLYAGDTK